MNLGMWLNNIGYGMRILHPSCQYVDKAACGFALCLYEVQHKYLNKNNDILIKQTPAYVPAQSVGSPFSDYI